MKAVLFACLILAVGFSHGAFLSHHMRPSRPLHGSSGEQPVFFTDYLNNPSAGRKATLVQGLDLPIPHSGYAGFFKTSTPGHNLYGWYFPAANGDPKAPLTIWLQGGPGGSSLFGLFTEVGPVYLDDSLTPRARNTSWNHQFGQLFIDNPVGSGFSYTTTQYCTNEQEISQDLYDALQQFLTIFPTQRDVPLYLTGESYAGHYIPAFGYKIHKENQVGQQPHVNFAGVAIGDGWIDPITQVTGYGDLLFNINLIEGKEREVVEKFSAKAVEEILLGNYTAAFVEWDKMLNGDISPYPSYFHNITGSDDYDNFMRTEGPRSFGFYAPYVNSSKARAGMHTGNLPLNDGHATEMNLLDDVMRSTKPMLETLMAHYKVLLYSGQLDIIVAGALTDIMLRHMQWPGADTWRNTPRKVWRVVASDVEVAGYVRQSNNFTRAIVRGAGHIVPYDQGRRALDLITRFVTEKPF